MNSKAYSKDIDVGEVTYTVGLLTPEAMALIDTRDQKAGERVGKYRARLSQIAENTYFKVKISRKEKADNAIDPTIDTRKFSYYESQAQHRFKLNVDGRLSISPDYVSYEDNFGLAPYETLILCFHHRLASEALTLVYDDALYGHPAVAASFSSNAISRLPKPTF